MSAAIDHSKGNAGGNGRKPAKKQGANKATPAVPMITLHAAGWRSKEDVYSALLPALGAPAWHGRNLDALNDSLVNGSINAVEPPLTLRFIGLSQAHAVVRSMIDTIETIIARARQQGRMYEIEKLAAEPANSSE